MEPTSQETYGNGVRKVIYRDPGGNEIGFGGRFGEVYGKLATVTLP